MKRILLATQVAALTASSQAFVSQAVASQGPGVAEGSASGATQTAMAVLVYGLCAATIALAAFRAATRRQ